MNALDCLPFAMQPAVKKATFQITNPENKDVTSHCTS